MDQAAKFIPWKGSRRYDAFWEKLGGEKKKKKKKKLHKRHRSGKAFLLAASATKRSVRVRRRGGPAPVRVQRWGLPLHARLHAGELINTVRAGATEPSHGLLFWEVLRSPGGNPSRESLMNGT